MRETSSLERVLLAYFSRAGENYYYGGRRDLDVGNTEVLARMIAELTEVDVHRIEATEPYPDSYDATVARNVTEQNDDARPGIANPLDSIDGYATVLLASPIWNVRALMIMSTFSDAYNFTGKTVLPVVDLVVDIAARQQGTPAQVTLAWLLAKSPNVVPHPRLPQDPTDSGEPHRRRSPPHPGRDRRDRPAVPAPSPPTATNWRCWPSGSTGSNSWATEVGTKPRAVAADVTDRDALLAAADRVQ
jgi:flavodoxin